MYPAALSAWESSRSTSSWKTETADALDKVVAEANMVRDAFINRLIMFVRSSAFLPEVPRAPGIRHGIGIRVDRAADADEPTQSHGGDPCRSAVLPSRSSEERHETGLYLLDMPPQLVGFSCYLDDALVPGTERYEEAQREVEELLRELDDFEGVVFTGAAAKAESQ
jgi:hypothetical protein